MLTKGYTIPSPTAVPSSDFPAYAGSEFLDFLGFSTCVGSVVELLPTTIIHVANISVTPAPSASLQVGATTTTSLTIHSSNATKPTATPGLEEPERIGIGVAVSFVALILVSLVAFIWRKQRLRPVAITAEKQGDNEDNREGTSGGEGEHQPYLQQKPELEAEEQQRHELEARQKIYELDGETEIKELPAGIYEHRLAVMRSRQELRGGEYSRELDS